MSAKYQVQDIAALAKLRLEDAESELMQEHFNRVLEAFESLSNLNTHSVEPLITPHQIFSPLRKDEVIKDLSQEELLENAPDVKDSLFKVPPVV